MKRFVLLVFVIAAIIPAQTAWSEDSGYRFDNLVWMKLVAGARAQALGGAFTARAHDGTAPHWNPALLEFLRPYETQVTFMALPLTLERRAAFVSYIQTLPEGYGTVSASWHYYRLGLIEERGSDGTRLGAMEDLQNAFSLSYGLTLNPEWKVGGSLHYYLHQVAGEQGQGIGLDLAAAFVPRQARRHWEFGLILKNVSPGLAWSTGRKESIPPTLTGGAAYHIFPGMLITSADLEWTWRQKPVLHTGVEWWPWTSVAVRFGLDAFGIHAGAGYQYQQVQVDYAYSALIEGISGEHRITVMFKI